MLRKKVDEFSGKALRAGRLKYLAFALTIPFIGSPHAQASMAKRYDQRTLAATTQSPMEESITIGKLGACVKGGRVEFDTPQGKMVYPPRGYVKGEVVCEENRALILEDSELVVIIPSHDTGGRDIGEIGVERTLDLGKIRRNGLVSWLPAGDSVLFITEDSAVTRVPLQGRKRFEYSLPVQTKGSRSIFHSGVLFIMPKGGSLVVMTFDGGAKWDYLPVRDDGSRFSTRNGRLYYGAGDGEVELRVEETSGNKKIISVLK
jgi:hypothetical protein